MDKRATEKEWNTCSNRDGPRDHHTKWSKWDRESCMWNPKKWYKWTYLQNRHRNRPTDIENKLLPKGKGRGNKLGV